MKDGRAVRMTRDEFAEYLESTFRYHNETVNNLISALSYSDEFEASAAREKAEEEMSALCQPLNNMVTATLEGRQLSFWSKLLLPNQVPKCAAASRRVEREISKL